MKPAPPQTVQVVHVTIAKPTRPRNNLPSRGDFAEIREQATAVIGLPTALMKAYNKNRMADVTQVVFNERIWAWQTKTFEERMSRRIGLASKPGMTSEQFLDEFCAPLPEPKR